MIKIQLTGLPCSGKTTAINSYIENNTNIEYIDIRSFQGANKFKQYRKKILSSSKNTIAESASGIAIPGTLVIRLEVDKDRLYERSIQRDGFLDESYLSLLETEMIQPQYTAKSVSGLHAILDTLFTRS